MPRLSSFYGIVIYLYIRDHGVAHVHAWHGDDRAVVEVATGRLLAGNLGPRQAAAPGPNCIERSYWRPGSAPGRAAARYHRRAHMNVYPPTPVVVGVAVIRPHVMRLLFDDGVVRDLQYTPSETRGSMVKPLADPDYFAQVRVDGEAGTVVWPNGLDLAPEVLHGDYEPENPLGFRDVSAARQSA